MNEAPKEFRIPIAVREVFKEDGKRYIFCRPGMKVAIEEAFVDGDIYKLDKALVVEPGQGIEIPVPAKYTQESVAGVFAAGLDEKGNIISRFPIGGLIIGEVESCPITIGALAGATPALEQCATAGQFTPLPETSPIGSRFKRFDVVVGGDISKLSLSDVHVTVGVRKDPMCQPGPMPFAMVVRDGALHLPTVIPAGAHFHFTLQNRGAEPVTLTGHLIFETAPDAKTAPLRDVVRN